MVRHLSALTARKKGVSLNIYRVVEVLDIVRSSCTFIGCTDNFVELAESMDMSLVNTVLLGEVY